jgi:hypothetical protein
MRAWACRVRLTRRTLQHSEAGSATANQAATSASFSITRYSGLTMLLQGGRVSAFQVSMWGKASLWQGEDSIQGNSSPPPRQAQQVDMASAAHLSHTISGRVCVVLRTASSSGSGMYIAPKRSLTSTLMCPSLHATVQLAPPSFPHSARKPSTIAGPVSGI